MEDEVKSNIIAWFDAGQIDYCGLYLKLYASFNAWYRQVSGLSLDRHALTVVRGRFVIWNDYYNGLTMQPLKPVFNEIVQLTRRNPLYVPGGHWSGVVESNNDWPSLIEFWYQVRCNLSHGVSPVPKSASDKRVVCAYESLNIFMAEIVSRMNQCFSAQDEKRLAELDILIESPNSSASILKEHTLLQEKYINSKDIWQVDMM